MPFIVPVKRETESHRYHPYPFIPHFWNSSISESPATDTTLYLRLIPTPPWRFNTQITTMSITVMAANTAITRSLADIAMPNGSALTSSDPPIPAEGPWFTICSGPPRLASDAMCADEASPPTAATVQSVSSFHPPL